MRVLSEYEVQSKVRNLILQFLDDEKIQSREDIIIFCFVRLNYTKSEISSRVDEVIHKLLAEHAIEEESLGFFRIGKNLPSDGDFRQSILNIFSDGRSRHLNEIRKFFGDQISIAPELIDDCIEEVFMPLVSEGKIVSLADGFYKLADKHEFTFPTQPELINLIRERLSDGKNHSVEEIREFCRLKLNIPLEQLEIVYESNKKPKFMILVNSAIFRMKESGEIERTAYSTYRLATKQNRVANEIGHQTLDEISSKILSPEHLRDVIQTILSDGLEHEFEEIKNLCTEKIDLFNKEEFMQEIMKLYRAGILETPRQGFYKLAHPKSRNTMPSQLEIHEPILKLLNDGQIHSRKEIHEFCARNFDLSNEILSIRNQNGTLKFFNRVDWALNSLKDQNSIVKVGRSLFQIANPK